MYARMVDFTASYLPCSFKLIKPDRRSINQYIPDQIFTLTCTILYRVKISIAKNTERAKGILYKLAYLTV